MGDYSAGQQYTDGDGYRVELVSLMEPDGAEPYWLAHLLDGPTAGKVTALTEAHLSEGYERTQ